jgi:predicted metalloprotease with PDZ domain
VGLNRRSSVDFYSEGDLLWLEVDTLIRQKSNGRKSLDSFCRQFYGGTNSGPVMVPYHYDDIVNGLNAIQPLDWNAFFQKRVYEIAAHAPLGGVENGGWHLAWTNGVPALLENRESQNKSTDLAYSLGFSISADGGIGDVQPESPADRAGIVQGMKLVAVNERAWSGKLLRDAVKTAATNSAPLKLLIVRDDYYRTFTVDYHGGERYPVLKREPSKPDLLDKILTPLTPEN